MDGYAVVAEDTFGASRYEPKTLRVVEKVYTGQVPTRRVGAGEAVEIATGAPMPEGADAVVMVEETERARRLRQSDGPHPHAGLPAAERRQTGRGHRLAARPCSAPATCSTRAASARSPRSASPRSRSTRKPSLAILSTGNEIVEPGDDARARTDLRHQSLHAQHDHRGARRRAGASSHGAGHASRIWSARSMPASKKTCSCSRAAARSASAI